MASIIRYRASRVVYLTYYYLAKQEGKEDVIYIQLENSQGAICFNYCCCLYRAFGFHNVPCPIK